MPAVAFQKGFTNSSGAVDENVESYRMYKARPLNHPPLCIKTSLLKCESLAGSAKEQGSKHVREDVEHVVLQCYCLKYFTDWKSTVLHCAVEFISVSV